MNEKGFCMLQNYECMHLELKDDDKCAECNYWRHKMSTARDEVGSDEWGKFKSIRGRTRGRLPW